MEKIEEQRKIFWSLFENILKEKGEPFKISYIHKITNEVTSYAAVNRKSSFNANAIDLNFSLRDRKFRVDLYITKATLIRKIMDNKDDINSMISLPLDWEDGKMVLRPSVYFDFNPEDINDYKNVIEKSLPTIIEFIEVAKKYDKQEFLDF